MRGETHGPVFEMLQRAASGGALRFHTPGHKGLTDLPGASFDLTELPDTDELFQPRNGILTAQREAARCWGAGTSFLLVNGSTAGIQAMVLRAGAQGRRLLLPRDCHSSLIYACALADMQPVWLGTQWDAGEQLACWRPEPADPALVNGKSALFLTYPDYYGRCVNLDDVNARLPGHDASLLIDSAHGAHFAFSGRLPLDAGAVADAWVSGAHKTLPAPTQTAFLHVKDGREAPAYARILSGLTTTSPSFPLMAGLDESRVFMQNNKSLLEDLIGNCEGLAERLNRLGGLRCWHGADMAAMGYAAHDPTRIVVDVRGLGMTGWQAGAHLRRLGVQPEMCDIYRVVLITTVMDGRSRLDRLYAAFCKLEKGKGPAPYSGGIGAAPAPGGAVLTIRRAWLSETCETALDQAAGRVAAEPFGAYPPGIPLCMPGEEITKESVETARQALSLGGTLFGVRDGRVSVVASL